MSKSAPWGTRSAKDDNKKATACVGGEMVWVEKRISPFRAARFGRNDGF
jgi:hypothetical protein